MKLIFWVFGLFSLILSFTSCKFENVEELSTAAACDGTYTYTDTVSVIIGTYCAIPTCHVPGFSSGDFSNYVGFEAVVSTGMVESRALISQDMPPSDTPGPKALNSCDKEILRNWIDNGAPE